MGRPRDEELDAAILRAATQLLAAGGVQALTFDAVAERAGTSRPAIYRRYDSRTELTVAALGELAVDAGATRTGDHLADLIAELAAFEAAITRLRSIDVAASVLLDATPQAIKDAYRHNVVRPRRRRLRDILDAAVTAGALDASEVERSVAVTMCTGSWYALALAGEPPPADWPQRIAELVWRSLGGHAER